MPPARTERRWRLPRLEILPRIVRSPVEICLGTSPSQAPKLRPFENASPVPIAATMALEMIGPMPGTVISRSQPLTSQRFDLAGGTLNARVQAAPVCRQIFEDAQHAGREGIASRRQNPWQLGPQETQPLPHRDSALQQEGADLIDDARALTDKPLAHPVERLQVELVGRLGSR